MPKVKCYCVICGNFIGEFYPSHIRRTCSDECYIELRRRNAVGTNNPNYKHGKYLENSHGLDKCPSCGRKKLISSEYCKKCRMSLYNPFKGGTHSKESLKKISEASKKMWKKRRKEIEGRKSKTSQGYIRVLNYSHPNADDYNHIFEHVLVMSEHLGRPIKPEERIHHINGIKTDNRISNLYLCENSSEHKKIHSSLEDSLPWLLENKIIIFEEGKYKKGVI